MVCGLLLGFVASGLLLTVLIMAPLPNKYPYPRFDATNPNVEKPKKVLFNVDGFVTAWFNIISGGSFSGKHSFAALHPDFLDQAFLNRLIISEEILLTTSSPAIEVPAKKAVWPAPDGLKDASGRVLARKPGYSVSIVRVGIGSSAIRGARGAFTPAQLRLICKPKDEAKNPYVGKGQNVYPAGYLKMPSLVELTRLNDQIKFERLDFDGKRLWIDFLFYVPNDSVPVFLEFKQNSIARVPTPVPADQAPEVKPFIQLSRCATDKATLKPISTAKLYGVEIATKRNVLAGLTLQISDPNEWQRAQMPESIKPAQFENGKITYVRAQLKVPEAIEEETEKQSEESRPKRRRRSREPEKKPKKAKGIRTIFEPLEDYSLVALKCNNPSTGTSISGRELPVLVELSGRTHHAVGVAAAGKVGEEIIYEVDYCSLTTKEIPEGLKIGEDDAVVEPFPESVWLTKRAETISEFYVLYLVKPKKGKTIIITSVRPGGSVSGASFKENDGFLID